MGTANRDEKNLEIKVGGMILAALAVLVIFILIVSDISFQSEKEMTIYFQNPGGLAPGVSVKVAGRKVGKVTEMTYVGQDGPLNPVTGRQSLVKVKFEIYNDAYLSLREDVHFYITSKGVLGDPFLEVDPGSSSKPIGSKAVLFGTDPPRLDLFLADAAELVKSLNRLLVTNADNLDNLIKGSSNIVAAVDALVSDDGNKDGNSARFARIMDNIEQLTVDSQVLLKNVNDKYVDNPDIEKSIKNMRSISTKLDRDIGPLLAEINSTMKMLNRVGDSIGPKEKEAIQNSLASLSVIAKKADNTVGKIDKIVDRVYKGEGTAGQLLADEEIYDDLKQLIRDLKQHPWKLIWED
ncbi:MAG: MCE family protein [Deltaproteobacteria bacterium]|nr:MCE family protein [Deltaproteobacteria bacterium]